MNKLFKKGWFQILFFGILTGIILIIVEQLYHSEPSSTDDKSMYNGPVGIEKSKTYFTSASLDETSFDFGEAREGDTLSHRFKIRNTGKEPLIIFKVTGSCDCIASKYSTEMTPPESEVILDVYFDTKGRKGLQTRKITVTCNTEPADILLTIKANIQ